jgi:hypothetical protein
MKSRIAISILAALICMALFVMPALSHHSFAMYDQSKTVVMTGTMFRFVGQANHAELYFYLIAPDRKGYQKDAEGKPVEWGVEMAGAAAVAQQGIEPKTFGVGTVFSVKVNPLRDGKTYGSRTGAIAKCPLNPTTNKVVLPAADKHCDSVMGMTLLGGTTF